jgi:hypothetical protein
MPFGQEPICKVATNKTGCARNEVFHISCSFETPLDAVLAIKKADGLS